MSGEVLDGVVRPGPPPADADRVPVIIRRDDGTITQAVLPTDDGTLIEVRLPGLGLDERARFLFGAQMVNPRSMIMLTGL